MLVDEYCNQSKLKSEKDRQLNNKNISGVFSGRFESQINSLSERIDSLRVLVEGAIDFSDEDIPEELSDLFLKRLKKINVILGYKI